MASPEFKKLLKFLESPPSDVSPTIAMRRALMDKWGDALPPAPGMTFESVQVVTIHAEWTRVPDVAGDRLLLYFHGGGFGMGSARNYRDLVSRLCVASHATALTMDYRLAPEHPFPAGLDDCVSVYQWLLASGRDARRIVFAGDEVRASLDRLGMRVAPMTPYEMTAFIAAHHRALGRMREAGIDRGSAAPRTGE